MSGFNFDIPTQDKNTVRRILSEAMEFSDRCWCDELDCKRSWCRIPSSKTPNEIIDLTLDGPAQFTCIFRKRYPEGSDDFYEFTASTMNITEPDYFLWIQVKPEYAEKIIQRYGLKIKE